MGDYEDLMTGVDRVIEMGVADPEKVGRDGLELRRFYDLVDCHADQTLKAASAGAPVTNLMSFNGTADIPSFVPDYFGGQAWENVEIYQNIRRCSTSKASPRRL
jgi:dipeptidyl aminopeptidase/acylaminoacyl peptidase